MSQATTIEWTDVSWNPTHGCSKVSPGCANCYAETLSLRYRQTVKPWTPANAAENVLLKPHKLGEPLSNTKHWRGLGAAAAAAGKTDGMLVFVNSTSDLFHEQVPFEYINLVFETMASAPQHTFQVLTKRPERMRDYMLASAGPQLEPLPNVWLGTSIENRRFVGRADVLRETPAAVRFISAEPLLGPLIYDATENACADPGCGCGISRFWSDGADWLRVPELDLDGIDWLIVGGESGHGHRPIREEWVRDLRDACFREAERRPWPGDGGITGPAFFFKQWGGRTPKAGGRELDGRTWDEFPAVPDAVGVSISGRDVPDAG